MHFFLYFFSSLLLLYYYISCCVLLFFFGLWLQAAQLWTGRAYLSNSILEQSCTQSNKGCRRKRIAMKQNSRMLTLKSLNSTMLFLKQTKEELQQAKDVHRRELRYPRLIRRRSSSFNIVGATASEEAI